MADQIQELKDIGEIAELSGWDPAGSKVKKMIEACNNKFSALRKGISTGPFAPGAAVKPRATIGWQEKDIRMKGDKVVLEAKDFTDGWKEVKALHPTLNIVPRPGGRGNGTERIMQATEEDGNTLFLKITKDHEGDFFLTLGRPTDELLAEEGGEQVEEEEDEGEGEGQGPTAEQMAVMKAAWEAAESVLAANTGQGEEEEQEARPKRARKPKPQAEEPAKSPKKGKGSPKKGKKGK